MPHRDTGPAPRARGLLAAVVAVALFLAACTDTPTPAPTATTAPTATPIPATATPLPTATPVPTPTPDPIQLDKSAAKAAFDGDYAHAIALEQQSLMLLGNPDSEAALRARVNIGKWHMENGAPLAAIEVLEPVAAISGSPVQTGALAMLGRARAANGEPMSATASYSAAIAAGSVISPWLQLWIGDAWLAANQPANAIDPLLASLDGAPTVSQEFARREKLALAYQLTSNFQAAIDQYDIILSRSQNAAYRARMLWESAQALLAAGQTAPAYTRLNEVVNTYRNTASAGSALQALLNAGQPVDEVVRGIIGYNSGLYEAAREAFRRAITLYPDRGNEVRYWAALNYIRLGSPTDAYRNLDQTITANPAGTFAVVQALGEKAKLLANADDAATAKTVFAQLAQNPGSGKDAAQVLFEVAQQFARNNNLVAEAAQAYALAESIAPNEEDAPEALIRAAALQYRLGQYTRTLTTTGDLLTRYGDKPQSLLAQLWLGKAQIASGNAPSGTATLQALATAAPDSYEGMRAAELVSDTTRAPLSLPVLAKLPDGQLDDAGRAEAETWLGSWTGITDTAKLRTLRDDIAGDLRFRRGNELWRLGFKAEAVDEFGALRDAFGADGVAQYQLAVHLRDIGLYRQSIGAADTLMRISPAKTPSALPAFVARLLYPAYYADLVQQGAEEYTHDPLLILALMRQESLFEPFAESFAAANGLMQIVPPTGGEINGDLNWPPNYSEHDLLKPFVSVRFGTYYLAKQRRYFNGDLYAAMAAYNGGAGNAMIWKERSGGDPDLFYMSVNFEETQRYIRAISSNYAIYHRLYR